jgi:long-chain fatty acid transport protein
MGSAYAGTAASAQDASTIYFNPAGMTKLEGGNLSAGVHGIIPRGHYQDEGSLHSFATPGTSLGTEESGDLGKDAFIPNFYYSQQLGEYVFLGLGVNVPFGMGTEYEDDWIGRYHATESEIHTININPSIAFKLGDHFSIGAGANAQYLEAKLSNAMDFGDYLGAPTTADGTSTVKGKDWGFGWNLGLLVEPVEGSRIGIHYRSKVKYEVEGTVEFENVHPLLVAAFVDSDASSDVELPASLTISLYQDINDVLEVMFDYSRTYWHVMDELRFEFDNMASDGVTTLKWKDSNRYSFGTQYKASDKWKIRTGVALDETPIPSAHYRTPRTPGEDRYWITLGAGYQATKNLSFDFGYAHIFLDDAQLEKQYTLDNNENDRKGNLHGEVDSEIDIVSLQMNYRF